MKYVLTGLVATFVLGGCAVVDKDEMTVAEGAEEVCRSITVSGTILPKRVCNNKATWAAIDEREREAAKEDLRKIRDRQGGQPSSNGFGG